MFVFCVTNGETRNDNVPYFGMFETCVWTRGKEKKATLGQDTETNRTKVVVGARQNTHVYEK